MEHKPTGGCGGVDILGKRPKARAMRLDRVHDVEKVTQGTGEAVVLGDGDNVALAQLIEQAVQLGPAARCAGDLVSEDPLCTSRLQGVELAVQALVFCTNAGISNDHVALCQKPPRTTKVLSWVFVRSKPLMRGRAGGQDKNDHFWRYCRIQSRKLTHAEPEAGNRGKAHDAFMERVRVRHKTGSF